MDQSFENGSDNDEVAINTHENSKKVVTEMLPPPLPIKEASSVTEKLEETKIIDETINESSLKSESKNIIIEETKIIDETINEGPLNSVSKNMIIEETVLLDSKETSANDEEPIDENGMIKIE